MNFAWPTLMVPLAFGDDLELRFSGEGFRVSCNHPDVPEDETNLALRAARLFYERAESVGIEPPGGFDIRIEKVIPVGGGLGGGSSNAAGVLNLLNRHHGSIFSMDQLLEMGLCLGADVPFFVRGRTALATGVGEYLSEAPRLKPYHVLILYPGIKASTAGVYKNLDLALTKQLKLNNNALLKSSRGGREVDVKEFLHNDLEESACRLYPAIRSVKEEMAACLPDGVLMTGSGASFFSLYGDAARAGSAFKELSKRWSGSGRQLFLTTFAKGTPLG